jgi:hypothetical protein
MAPLMASYRPGLDHLREPDVSFSPEPKVCQARVVALARLAVSLVILGDANPIRRALLSYHLVLQLRVARPPVDRRTRRAVISTARAHCAGSSNAFGGPERLACDHALADRFARR